VFFYLGHGFYCSIVIDLSIAMRAIFSVVLLLILAFFPHQARAQAEALPVISSPSQGQIVQGSVVVTGTVSALGFSSYELSFAYAEDPTQTWFVLTSGSEPIFVGQLGTWDTTTLTDGDYSLRLRSFMLDGTVQEALVSGLRVRNYTPVPTSTFTPTATAVVQFAPPTALLVAPAPDTATPSLPTPTGMPPNPASLQEAAISNALGQGAALALLLFAGFGLLLRLRRE
jgi:hypothetical protein